MAQIVSKRNWNHGRRFYGCLKWKDDDREFFEWIDKEAYGQRATEVILALVSTIMMPWNLKGRD
ncbi:hypothetical protein BVRB_4g083550 [Beta vulgaris subsp. vulgaris]|uniref:GRF-type domain-containing protein n=1 Tax=Beta vulgaris subsp. vulgaris TaxID=3555 RepID=A0A0J8CN42_BETVV|nr:hypothetical protein BVRB_4g083550 [Beta vulgaris subsp. vulgaris]